MSEYERIGEGLAFWRKYQNQIDTVDASLVTPVLTSLGAVPVGDKWVMDNNVYRCGIGAKEYELLFDMRDDVSEIVDVIVSRSRGDERVKIGQMSVQLPCETWEGLQAQFKALLRV
jgi:hypothetical protein